MLPTGLTYSSLAKRFMSLMASGTCGVGRRVFRSSFSRAARRETPTVAGLPRSFGSVPSPVAVAAPVPFDGARGGTDGRDVVPGVPAPLVGRTPSLVLAETCIQLSRTRP